MVRIAFDLKQLLKCRLIVVRIILQPDHILIPVKFKRIYLIQLPVRIQPVILQRRFIQLLDLRIQPVILKCRTGILCQVLHIQMDKLSPKADHLRDGLDQVIRKLVPEPQPLCHVLV